jgi:hypothetical protein
MSNPSFPVLLFVLLASSSATQATPPSPAPVMDAAVCNQLAGNPNAPLSVEACRTMMRMGEDDPSTHRPGDEALSCAQIFAEMQTMQGDGVSDANAEQTDALIGESKVLGAKHAAEMARQMTPSPLAIASSLLPNAIGAAVMAPEYARQAAAMAQLTADDARFNAQLAQHSTSTSVDLNQLMDANPRLPRLMQLSMQKACKPPD